MFKYLTHRVLKGIITLVVVLIFVFVGARLTGDPFSVMYGDGLTQQELAQLNAQYGLDKPVVVQFGVYIENAIKGDFGKSIVDKRPVTEIIALDAKRTLSLGIWAFVLSILVGTGIGIIASLRPNSLIVRGLMGITVLGYSVPGFVISILLIYIFSFKLKIFPSMGMESAKSFVLPVFALSVHPIASISRYVRTSFMDVLSQDYIRTARSKGLGERSVIFKHGFKNILNSLVTVIGMLVINIVNGALFIEAVFSWPGMGKRLVESVMNKDFPVLQFGVICFAVVVITVNLLIDSLYGIIDPRIRKEY